MANRENNIINFFSLSFLFLLLVVVATNEYDVFNMIKRSDFPKGFGFGSASAAYQYEGGVSSKGKSIWDTLTHLYPERILDRSNGDVALDSYHRYKEDLSIMEKTGFNLYRFSIAWSRILPKGTLKGGINQQGIDYYNSLINTTLKKGMEPYVTLFHWDVPQALEDEYKGLLDRRFVDDYVNYVDLCFRLFGDRVKHWITLNEPNLLAINGYEKGVFAPGRCSGWIPNNCCAGNSSIEPYIVSHHQILAHAHAVRLYQRKYQKEQEGVIGITVIVNWYEPYSNTAEDKEAANRANEFFSGWFFDPIVHGDYPQSMRIRVKDRLPKFNEEEKVMIKGSFDFLGVNYYTALYAIENSDAHVLHPSWSTDSGVNTSISLGPKVNPESWLAIYPPGIEKALVKLKIDYNDPHICITENGSLDFDDRDAEKLICDKKRTLYHITHLYHLRRAISRGVKVIGYIAWSLLDTFEWQDGYTKRFGLVYIDRPNNLTRIPKKSLEWFSYFLKN